MKLIEGAKAINAAVTKAARDVASLKEQVHLICVSAAMHHAKTGDETIIQTAINKLCDVMEKASHNNAVRVWFETYSCLSWSAEAKCFKHNAAKVKEANKDLTAYEETLINSKRYYDLTKPQEFKPVNMLGVVISAVNRFAKMSPEEQADPRNKVEGMDELITVIKKHGMGDKLEIKCEPLVEDTLAMGRAAA